MSRSVPSPSPQRAGRAHGRFRSYPCRPDVLLPSTAARQGQPPEREEMTMVETSSTTLMTRPTAAAPPEPPTGGRTTRLPGSAVVDRAVEINQRFSPTLLRLALASVFVWFGALKLIGASPVYDLIARTLPFIDADISVPALGVVEVALGLVLATGFLPRIT